MNKTVTSKEEILDKSREIIAEKGVSAINMRTVATQCGIAVGSLYNYFASKSELMSAAVEAVWKDIFQVGTCLENCEDILEYMKTLLEAVKSSRDRYPQFFSMHALHFTTGEKPEGRRVMKKYFLELKVQMISLLEQDKQIRAGAFTDKMTPEIFVNYIFKLFLAVLLENQEEEIFLEFIKNYLYEIK